MPAAFFAPIFCSNKDHVGPVPNDSSAVLPSGDILNEVPRTILSQKGDGGCQLLLFHFAPRVELRAWH